MRQSFAVALCALLARQALCQQWPPELRVRQQGDTAWLALPGGIAKRVVLKHDTLVTTTEQNGTRSTVTWLLGRDSSRMLSYEGKPPLRPTMRTAYVMKEWEFARLYRYTRTGEDGSTYDYERIQKPTFTSKASGDTVWLNQDSGDTYRSILRNDTLWVSEKLGGRVVEQTWLVKGDSARMLDKSGKTVFSVRKELLLNRRLLDNAPEITRPE